MKSEENRIEVEKEEIVPLSEEEVQQFIHSGSQIAPLDLDKVYEELSEEPSSLNLAEAISEDIRNNQVRNHFIEEQVEVDVPCFIIDLRNTPVIEHSLLALQSILYKSEEEYAETAYKALRGAKKEQANLESIKAEFHKTSVYIQTDDRLLWVGLSEQYEMDILMERVVKEIFPEEAKLYKNSGDGSGFIEVTAVDVSHIKLFV